MSRALSLRLFLRGSERTLSRPVQLSQASRRFSAAQDNTQPDGDPSIIQSVLLPNPPNQPSIFEELDNEYESYRPTATPVSTGKEYGNQAFRTLVKGREYDKAVHLREELLTVGIQLDQDATFEVLEDEVNRVEHLSVFLKIWDLVPDFRYVIRNAPEQLQRFDRLLASFQRFAMDIPSMVAFGKMCASKGYGPYVAAELVSHIVRHGTPSLSSAFVAEFDDITSRLYPETYWIRTKRSFWYNMAIRTQARSGRWDAACDQLFAAVANPDITIDRRTYNMLIQRYTDADRPDLLAKIAVQARQDYPGISLEPVSLDAPMSLDETILTHKDDQEAALAFAKGLARPRTWTTKHIADFISYCENNNRREILDWVRVLAQGPEYFVPVKSLTWIGRWTEAMMLHAWRREQRKPREVLRLYEECFRVKGTPIEYLMPIDRDRPVSINPYRAKLWPTSNAQDMALQSIIMLAYHWEALENLYLRFLSSFFGPSDGASTDRIESKAGTIDSDADADEFAYQVPPRMRPREYVFYMFLRGFRYASHNEKVAAHKLREKALQILRDMSYYGVSTPTHIVWTEIIGILARHPDPAGVMSVLHRMEGNQQEDDPEIIPQGMETPKPDIAVYTMAISRLLEARSVHAAAHVRELARLSTDKRDELADSAFLYLSRVKKKVARKAAKRERPHQSLWPGIFKLLPTTPEGRAEGEQSEEF